MQTPWQTYTDLFARGCGIATGLALCGAVILLLVFAFLYVVRDDRSR